jgi:hypothetical protein
LEKYTDESKKFSHSFGQNYGKTFQGIWDASFGIFRYTKMPSLVQKLHQNESKNLLDVNFLWAMGDEMMMPYIRN